jgi:hypothetical protein
LLYSLTAAALLITSAAAHAVNYRLKPDAPEAVRVWWEAQPALKAERKVQLAAKIEAQSLRIGDMRSGQITVKPPPATLGANGRAKYTFPSVAARTAMVNDAVARVRVMKQELAGVDSDLIYPREKLFSVGVIAELRVFRVRRIIDDTSMIARVAAFTKSDPFAWPDEGDVWLKGIASEGRKVGELDAYLMKPQVPMWSTETIGAEYDGKSVRVPLVVPFDAKQFLVAE